MIIQTPTIMVSGVCRKRWGWTMMPFTSWTATWTLKSMALTAWKMTM